MIIKNAFIYNENGRFCKGSILIREGIIGQIIYNENQADILMDDCIIDAEDMYVVPGFIDIHLHGCAGHDFCEGKAESFDAIAKYQLENGITGIVPATMTLSEDKLERIFKAAGEYINNYEKTYDNEVGDKTKYKKMYAAKKYNTILGITMEGPFISKAKKGAQAEGDICKPDIEMYMRFQKLSNNSIRQVVVAPEEDYELKFIKEVSKETVVSLGHTMSDYATAEKAFKAGASHVTHLFNAMQPFGHREPAVVGAAFDNSNVYVELICDGIHVQPSMVRAAFKLFGSGRICMISDSMMAAGLTDGEYTLGGQAVKVCGKTATLEDGTIAGSVTNLYECLKLAVLDMKIPLEQAVRSCTLTPAEAVGLDNICGCLKAGRNADLVIMDRNLNIKYVLKYGEIIQAYTS